MRPLMSPTARSPNTRCSEREDQANLRLLRYNFVAPLGVETARRLRAVVALKGSSTHVVSHQGDSVLNDQGTIGLATSGSGDTLAGIIAGLIARGAAAFLATVWGVYLHAAAGRNLARQIGPL